MRPINDDSGTSAGAISPRGKVICIVMYRTHIGRFQEDGLGVPLLPPVTRLDFYRAAYE